MDDHAADCGLCERFLELLDLAQQETGFRAARSELYDATTGVEIGLYNPCAGHHKQRLQLMRLCGDEWSDREHEEVVWNGPTLNVNPLRFTGVRLGYAQTLKRAVAVRSSRSKDEAVATVIEFLGQAADSRARNVFIQVAREMGLGWYIDFVQHIAAQAAYSEPSAQPIGV